MRHKFLQFNDSFRVVLGNDSSQAAEMTLAPGAAEGGPTNRHRGSDQWLFVVAGEGVAMVDHIPVVLRAETLLRIDRGEEHEIRNTGNEPLRALNVYVPPAYTDWGDELPAGRS